MPAFPTSLGPSAAPLTDARCGRFVPATPARLENASHNSGCGVGAELLKWVESGHRC